MNADPLLSYDAQIAATAVEKGADLRTQAFAAWDRVESESLHGRYGTDWMDHLFRAGIGGLLIHYGEGSEMYRRIAYEVKQLKKLTAVIAAAQAGIGVTLADALDVNDAERFDPVGLMPWFRDWRKQKERENDPNWRKAVSLAKELATHCREHGIAGTFHGLEVGAQPLAARNPLAVSELDELRELIRYWFDVPDRAPRAHELHDKLQAVIESGWEPFTLGEYRELHAALMDLSMACGNPALEAEAPATIQSELVRFAARRLGAP